MNEYQITYYNSERITVDVDTLKDAFPEEWELADDEVDFIETVFKEYGIDYVKDSDIVSIDDNYIGDLEIEKL